MEEKKLTEMTERDATKKGAIGLIELFVGCIVILVGIYTHLFAVGPIIINLPIILLGMYMSLSGMSLVSDAYWINRIAEGINEES